MNTLSKSQGYDLVITSLHICTDALKFIWKRCSFTYIFNPNKIEKETRLAYKRRLQPQVIDILFLLSGLYPVISILCKTCVLILWFYSVFLLLWSIQPRQKHQHENQLMLIYVLFVVKILVQVDRVHFGNDMVVHLYHFDVFHKNIKTVYVFIACVTVHVYLHVKFVIKKWFHVYNKYVHDVYQHHH